MRMDRQKQGEINSEVKNQGKKQKLEENPTWCKKEEQKLIKGQNFIMNMIHRLQKLHAEQSIPKIIRKQEIYQYIPQSSTRQKQAKSNTTYKCMDRLKHDEIIRVKKIDT